MAQDVVTRFRVESEGFNQKVKQAAAELNRMTTVAEQEGTKIAAANAENVKFFQNLGKMGTSSTTASGKMRELTSAIEAATIMYNRMDSSMKKGEGGRALAASISQLQTKLAGLKTEMATVQGQMGKTQAMSSGMGGMGGFGAGLKGGLAMMGPQAAGFAAIAGAAMGVKKAFSDLIGINKEFEQSHANLASVMGKTRGETEALATQAKQLGATTQYTAMQILDLQTNLARLGFSEQEILNSTKAVQALATATNADLGEAANLAGAALRGFGLDASEMDRVSSVLAVSTSKSALSFEKLATAIPIVAPVAKQFGFSIEDTVTMIGKLSDAGMDASSAATATRNIFLKMADGGGKLSQAMGRPVHSVEEFGEALKDMKERGMDLNDILKMVGVRSTAAFAVFADNADTLKDFKGEITNCGDQLDKMVAEQLNTLEGSLKILNSAWEGLMLSFQGSNVILKAVTDKLAELLQAWSNWNNRRQGGEAAISTYTTEMTRQDENKIKTGVDRQLQRGTSAETIIENTSKKVKELSDQNKAMTDLLSEWEKAGKLGWGSKEIESLKPAVEKTFGKMNGAAYEWKDQMFEAIAAVRDELAKKEFKLEYAQSKIKVEEPTTSTGLGTDLAAESRAKIEAEMQKAIADLEKVNMIKEGKEQEYEDTVYQIKFAAYDRIKKLYAEDTKEYSQWQAKQEQLTIQHQNTTLRLLKKTESEAAKAAKQAAKEYTGYGDFTEESISARLKTAKGRQSKMEIGSEGYLIEANKIVDLTTFQNIIKTALKDGIELDEWDLREKLMGAEGIDFNVDIPDSEWQKLVDEINEKRLKLGKDPIKLDVATGNLTDASKEAKANAKSTADAWQNAVAAVNNVGSALQQIEDPAAKVAGIVMQAVANIALGFAQAVASPATGAAGVFGWIAAATAGLATMVSTIAAVKSATSGSYASGGIIPGNSYSGDNLTANVNSGELILNRSQQDSIASQLQGGATQTIVVEGRISGKDILLSANNTNRAAGGSRGYYTKVK